MTFSQIISRIKINKNREGYDENLPWIREVPFPNDIEAAKNEARFMVELGFTNVTLAEVDDNFYMEKFRGMSLICSTRLNFEKNVSI